MFGETTLLRLKTLRLEAGLQIWSLRLGDQGEGAGGPWSRFYTVEKWSRRLLMSAEKDGAVENRDGAKHSSTRELLAFFALETAKVDG